MVLTITRRPILGLLHRLLERHWRVYKHSAVWTGDEMIIWGGSYDTGGTNYYLADGYRYFCDPVK